MSAASFEGGPERPDDAAPTDALEPRAATLSDIRSERIRNLVRGIIAASSDTALQKTMERLRREASMQDAVAAFRFLYESKRAQHIVRAAPFPESAVEVDGVPFYSAASIEIELLHQRLRFAYESDKLVQAIRLVARLNDTLLQGDSEGASQLFSEYRERFGISLLVAQKAMSARHSAFADGRSAFSDVIAPFLAPRRQVIAVAFEDSIDAERDYGHVRRTFLEFVTRHQVDADDAAIICDIFSPFEADLTALSQRLQAYGRWGVLDTVAYLFRLRRSFEQQGYDDGVRIIDTIIPAPVFEAWRSAFASADLMRLQAFVGIDDQFFDRALFAHLPAWSEYEAFFDYRMRIEEAIGNRLDGNFPVAEPRAHLVASPCSAAEELLFKGQRRISITDIDPATSGGFHRTIALIASIEAGNLENIDGEKLCRLLDETIDVPNLLSRAELATFLPRRRDDLLYEFLRTAVGHDLEESSVSNHALRRSLQHLVKAQFNGDIVALLQHIDTENGHVSRHLYNLCSEAFLIELYSLYTETDLVIEANARILEWKGERGDDEDARLRARSHRLNLRLRKVRGAIEETRIYVDPLRFLAWIAEKKSGDLRTLSLQAEAILADPDRSLNFKDGLKRAMQPRLKLLELFDKCYEEFCTNKIYGVTSFIGRRIRHGTLHGHLVLESKPEIDAAIREFRTAAPQFADFLTSWYARFDAAVEAMAADQIHVRSKDKPRGLIIATLSDPEKSHIAERMVEGVASIMKDRTQLSPSTLLIQEYCWLLLEVDLVRTRDAVERLRREFVIDVDDHQCERPELDRRVGERIRALNSAIKRRFETAQSWFTRPTNQSPSASVGLLCAAVHEEVSQRIPGYCPKVDFTGSQDVDLIGHRFHLFYDALFILVGNAARHGQRDGLLRIHVDSDFGEKFADLSVFVTSEFVSGREAESRAAIEEAMRAEIGDAVLKNNKSGISKLRDMAADVEEIMDFSCAFQDRSVIFRIDVRYIRT